MKNKYNVMYVLNSFIGVVTVYANNDNDAVLQVKKYTGNNSIIQGFLTDEAAKEVMGDN